MATALGEWMFATLILLLGLLFLADYHLGWPASHTWPAFLVVWGAFRAAAGMIDPTPSYHDDRVADVPLPRRPSVFAPALVIFLGLALLANNYYQESSLLTLAAFGWPWILVAWGGSWMMEDAAGRSFHARRPRPLSGGSLVLALLICLLGIAVHGVYEFGSFDLIRL